MKRLYNAIVAIIFVIALSMVSCEQPYLDNFSKETEIILKAEFADSTPGTRTTITDDSADPMPLSWLEGDAINVFFGNSKSSIFTTAVSGRVAEFSGSINGVVGGVEGATQENFLWGVYPYSSKTTCDGSSVIYTLPSVQTAVAGTFADDLYPAIARSQNFYMSFYNVCGGFRFKVSNPDIVKVTLKGNKGEALAGKAKITMDKYPVVEEILEGLTELTMTAPDGGCFEVGKYYYFVAYPIEFSEGLTITYHKKDSQADYVVSNEYTLPRNKFSSFTNRDADLTFVKTDGHYIDEYGVNHGPGVEIDGVVWAPVNCGYHATDFKYGKLYQWGRKYGQGYSGEFNGNENHYISDAITPIIKEGGISIVDGRTKANENIFFLGIGDSYDWVYPSDDRLWNLSTEESPIKTENDPCPRGWRVPSYQELMALVENKSSWEVNYDGQEGYWFSGSATYSDIVSRIFLPASGERVGHRGQAINRGDGGFYWSSEGCFRVEEYDSHLMYFDEDCVEDTYGDRSNGFSVRCVKDSNTSEEEYDVKVQKIYMLTESATLAPGTEYKLDTDYEPIDATNTTWEWSSSDASIAYVDDSGNVTAIADGEATITATATDGSGVSASSTISVVAITAIASAEYKDEYGVNHGRGIAIGDVVWAPVNCGYKAPTIDAQGNVTDKGYPYGKLYQWGRKYGQGYDEKDASIPELIDGPISAVNGHKMQYSNTFFTVTKSSCDWISPQDDSLWNDGTDKNPTKTNYDPCPEGWRVPTYVELSELYQNSSSWTSENDQKGYYFSGAYSYYDNAPQIFFSAAGYRNYSNGESKSRGKYGRYWSSKPNGQDHRAGNFGFDDSYTQMNDVCRARGFSIRCVQE